MAAAAKHRVRRLVVIGLLWALMLFAGAIFIRVAAARHVSPIDSVQVARGDLPVFRWTTTSSGVDRRLSGIASRLARRPVDVHCWSDGDWRVRAAEWKRRWPWLGELDRWRAYTFGRPPAIQLSPPICEELAMLAEERTPVWKAADPDALAWSVATLAHESEHAAGISSELKANCFGMQLIRTVAVGLGRTPEEGQYLAEVFWLHWQPWMSLEYQSHQCRDGGDLDLHRQTGVWP